jgi:large subunit ribosomal protein L18
MKKKGKKIYLQARKRSLKKIIGNASRPRLSVFRSNFHIYAQLIDDQLGQTLASASTLEKKSAKELVSTATKDAAFEVGKELAKRSLEKDISKVVFDRGKKAYHGRIEKLAEGARTQGLIF